MSELASSTVPTSGSGAKRGKAPCEVIFLRVFDLAYFFGASSKDLSKRPIHFLENRTGELSRSLFGCEVSKDNIRPLYKESFWTEAKNWKSPKGEKEDEQKREEEAYAAGWVRAPLLNTFFPPTYKYRKSVFEVIPTCARLRAVCGIYRDEWIYSHKPIRAWLDTASLSLTISPYGIASVRLELKVPIADPQMGIGGGREFEYVQRQLVPMFSSDSAQRQLEERYPKATGFPSWLTFIALSAIWQFLNELEQEKKALFEWEQPLGKWWGDVISQSFEQIWNECIGRPFPLRHEAAYYYFEHNRYEQNRYEHKPWGEAPTEADLDCMLRLGLLVSSQEASGGKSQELFAKDVRQKLDKEDLCVTDNGYAFVVGNSLIVAAKREKYRIQGSIAEESAYWRWMFRMLCCLRECFMLCDISSREMHNLRERYESKRRECFKDGERAAPQREEEFEKESRKLLDELAQVASLLFTVEEGTHAVAASRVPFVQEKFRTFVDHLALSDLLENVNKRRQRLEQRLHDEMSRLSQGRMERLAKATDKVGKFALFFSIVAAVLSLYLAYQLEEHVKDLKEKVELAVKDYIKPLNPPSTSKRAAESLEEIKVQGKQAQDSVPSR